MMQYVGPTGQRYSFPSHYLPQPLRNPSDMITTVQRNQHQAANATSDSQAQALPLSESDASMQGQSQGRCPMEDFFSSRPTSNGCEVSVEAIVEAVELPGQVESETVDQHCWNAPQPRAQAQPQILHKQPPSRRRPPTPPPPPQLAQLRQSTRPQQTESRSQTESESATDSQQGRGRRRDESDDRWA